MFVYFHGQPGGPDEFALCAPETLKAFAPDRNAPVTIQRLTDAITAHCSSGNLTLIGFSLGASIAMATAVAMGDRVERLHLISPAAPLQLGDFMSDMAGAPLFRMAMSHPAMFKAIASMEGLVARLMPGFLFDRLFSTTQGGDAALIRDPAFRAGMAGVLRAGIGQHASGFAEEVCAYVDDWRDLLPKITTPVTIWQGDADNWTPPSMAEALTAALPDAELHRLPECSHYSTLRTALARIAG